MKKIIVIGGGASGMIAAIKARMMNNHVTILEKNNKLGKKILATGNGRCNFMNIHASEHDYNHPAFVKSIFDQFGINDTKAFFESLGIIAKVEDFGKAYPMSEQAQSITEVLINRLEELKVLVVLNADVYKIEKQQQFEIFTQTGEIYKADQVILSTGGKAMPLSGSTGIGYDIAKKLGHEVTDIFPALVKLELDYPYLRHMDGVKIDGSVSLIHNNHTMQTEKGDVLFTKYGISGPTILQLSRKAIQLFLDHQMVFIKVQILSVEDDILYQRFMNLNDKTVEDSLLGLINKKLIKPVIKEARLEPTQYISSLDKKQLNRLIRILKDWRFKVSGFKGFEDAQVTAGGIKISEVDETLESRRIKGLYFTGELLDVDGLCGGYNLQWAWSSGYVAGRHAGENK